MRPPGKVRNNRIITQDARTLMRSRKRQAFLGNLGGAAANGQRLFLFFLRFGSFGIKR